MTKPIIHVINHCMSFKELKIVLVKVSADIRVFGHTCLFVMLLLIGLTLFVQLFVNK